MKREIEDDGNLSRLNNYLASQNVAKQVSETLQSDLAQEKEREATKNQLVMRRLEELGLKRDEKIIYEFSEGSKSSKTDLDLINYPFIEVEGAQITIRYLFASRSGWGYISWIFDGADLMPEGNGNIKIHSPLLETSIGKSGLADDHDLYKQIEGLQLLNTYFSSTTHHSYDATNDVRVYLSPSEKDRQNGQIDIYRRDYGSAVIKLHFSNSEEEVMQDLENILEKMIQNDQEKIDAQNRSLTIHQNRSSMADNALLILSGSSGEEVTEVSPKKRGLRFPSLKRKRG